MIELRDLRKSYKTGDFVQKALDGVSLAFRDNEFVAVLGPSGSGKTTLLNVLGGLDRADSGEIVINGTSTRAYRSADWDTYRNHRIGFIFQSYNLIPHQSVLANVELALTLAGVGRAERRARAKAALERVGLGEHVHKKPAQLSGGQMQRVAIARALVNDPDIVLADEPTGALDTETGIAVMNLLQEIASDRLVIMVTHNPELAEEYATRIVRLADGRIVDDSDPFEGVAAAPEAADGKAAKTAAMAPIAGMLGERDADAAPAQAPQAADDAASQPAPATAPRRKKRARMGFLTALGLSFNNLMTKKGRTFMTAFAGSIGIIGIAAILSLSNGVNNYIADTEEAALTSYPLTITKSSFDLTSLLTSSMGLGDDDGEDDDPMAKIAAAREQAANPTEQTARTGLIPEISIMTDMFARVKSNDLSSFRAFLESPDSGLEPYVNTIHYAYGITPYVYAADTDDDVVQLNPGKMTAVFSNGVNSSSALLGGTMSMSVFQRMLDDEDIIKGQVDLVLGRWPQRYDEALLVLSSSGHLMDYTLYSLGWYDPEVMNEMTQNALNGEEVVAPPTAQDFTYEDALQMHFTVLPAACMYERNEAQGTWTDISGDDGKMRRVLAEDGIDLKIVGVVQPQDGSTSLVTQGVAYKGDLTRELIARAADSAIVQQQRAHDDVDVFTGKTFEELQDDQANEFDLGSMFNVDEARLQEAFGMDESSFDVGGLDFGGLDLSGMDFDLSGLDLGSLDLGSLDASAMGDVLSADSMQQIMAGAPQFSLDLGAMLAGGSELTEEEQQAIADGSNQLAAGFFAWAVTNGRFPAPDGDYSALFVEYTQSDPDAQAVLAQVGELAGSTFAGRINTAMQDYMVNQFAPYMQSAMTGLFQQAAQAMMTQMANSMAQQMAAATAAATSSLGNSLSAAISGQLGSQMSSLTDALSQGFSFDADAFADAIEFNMSQEDLTSLLTNFMNADELTYDANLKKLGWADLDKPESISIYAKDFPSKEAVLRIIDAYNDRLIAAGRDDETIQYSDIAGALMSSVTDIVDTISLVLIAFVSISLVVSSIMIGIITYISVLERKKEIGILRAMGASKVNVANVFNAETVIEGLIAGVLAIAVVLGASVPVNAIVEAGWDVPNVMSLPWESAAVLIALSVALTFVAGLLPSQAAARRDPVEALRSE